MVSFPYRREWSSLLGEILRPVASVDVRAGGRGWFPALMYVDSGADLTLVPRDFGKLLRLDMEQNRGAVAGIGGTRLQVSLHTAEVRVGSSVARARIAVALRNDVPYLLGREGLFRLFKITFQEYKSKVRFDLPG